MKGSPPISSMGGHDRRGESEKDRQEKGDTEIISIKTGNHH